MCNVRLGYSNNEQVDAKNRKSFANRKNKYISSRLQEVYIMHSAVVGSQMKHDRIIKDWSKQQASSLSFQFKRFFAMQIGQNRLHLS